MFLQEAGLLAQELHREGVRDHHHHHRDVEGHQRTEHEEGPVVDDALLRARHDVAAVDNTWKVSENSKE